MKKLLVLFSFLFFGFLLPYTDLPSQATFSYEVSSDVTDWSSDGSYQIDTMYHAVKLFNQKLSVSIPINFTLMDSAAKVIKYPNPERPHIVYTNDDGSINITFKEATTPSGKREMSEFLVLLLRNLLPGSLKLFLATTQVVNGSDFAVIEVLTPTRDTKIYNFMFATTLNGKIIIGSINCPENQMREQKSKAREVLASIKKI